MAGPNGNDQGKKKLMKAKPLPVGGGKSAGKPAAKPVGTVVGQKVNTPPVGAVVPSAATSQVVVQSGSGSATSIRRRKRKSRNNSVALILVVVPLIILGGVFAYLSLPSDEAPNKTKTVAENDEADDAPKKSPDAPDDGQTSPADKSPSNDSENVKQPADKANGSSNSGNEVDPDPNDPPANGVDPADPPGGEDIRNPAVKPAVEPVVDPPPGTKPFVGPAELLTTKGFAKTETGWLASEEVELKSQLERARFLEGKIKKTGAKLTPEGLAKLRAAIGQWMTIEQMHKKALATRTDAGLTPELDRISAAAHQHRSRVKGGLGAAVTIQNQIVESARELAAILETAESNLAAAKKKYEMVGDDEQITAAAEKLNAKVGPSESWKADQAQITKLKLRLPDLETPPSLKLDPRAKAFIEREDLLGEIAKENPDPDAPPKR